jgi:hypothetical protein
MVGQAADRGRWASAQLVRNPAQPRQRTKLNRGTEPVLDSDLRAQPAKVVAGQGEVRDEVVVGDLVRPATQPRELGVGQEPNRHEARYPRRSTPDKSSGPHPGSPPAKGVTLLLGRIGSDAAVTISRITNHPVDDSHIRE